MSDDNRYEVVSCIMVKMCYLSLIDVMSITDSREFGDNFPKMQNFMPPSDGNASSLVTWDARRHYDHALVYHTR